MTKPSPTTPFTASSPISVPHSSKRWASSSAKASPASSCSWPIPASSCLMMRRSSRPCARPRNTAVSSVCTRKTAAPSTSSSSNRSPKYHAPRRPTTAEAEAPSRAIALAEMAGPPVYIVHFSCNEALEKVREARDRGLPAYAETCPQYLYLSLENMDAPGFEGAKYVFTPPLREKWHQEKLWQGLARDTLQVVSTDHCPFCFKEQKDLGKDDFTKITNGGPVLDNLLSFECTGAIHGQPFSLNRFRPLVATAPANLFGLYPRRRTIAVCSDADLVIFDPN